MNDRLPIRRSATCPAGRRRCFTLIELLVVVAIIVVLVAILLPALNNARAITKLVTCASQVREIGLAETMYGHDNDGTIPPGSAGATCWDDRLRGDGGSSRYIVGVQVFRCPADTTPPCSLRPPSVYPKQSYSCNIWFHGDIVWGPWPPAKVRDIERPSTTMSIVDTWHKDHTCFYGWYVTVAIPRQHAEDNHRNFTQTNELYFDGHVKTVRYDEYILPHVPTDPLWLRHYRGG